MYGSKRTLTLPYCGHGTPVHECGFFKRRWDIQYRMYTLVSILPEGFWAWCASLRCDHTAPMPASTRVFREGVLRACPRLKAKCYRRLAIHRSWVCIARWARSGSRSINIAKRGGWWSASRLERNSCVSSRMTCCTALFHALCRSRCTGAQEKRVEYRSRLEMTFAALGTYVSIFWEMCASTLGIFLNSWMFGSGCSFSFLLRRVLNRRLPILIAC